jgi:ribonuclease HIII
MHNGRDKGLGFYPFCIGNRDEKRINDNKMSSADKNLSDFIAKNLPDISHKKFAIVVSEWNEEITSALYEGAYNTLLVYGAKEENIIKVEVPGSFELSLGSQKYAQRDDIDAVIALGASSKETQNILISFVRLLPWALQK